MHCSVKDFTNEYLLEVLGNLVPVDLAYTLASANTPLLRRVGSSEARGFDEASVLPSIKLWTKIFRRLGNSDGRKTLQRVIMDYPATLALLHADNLSKNITDGERYKDNPGNGTDGEIALSTLVGSMFDSSIEEDLQLARELCEYWVTKYIHSDLSAFVSESFSTNTSFNKRIRR